MAIVSHLTDGIDTTAGTTATTASVTPAQDTLVLVSVFNDGGAGIAAPTVSVSGAGLTFTQVATQVWGASSRFRQSLFRAAGAATSGALTIDAGATSCVTFVWSVDQMNYAVATNNGADGIVQSATAIVFGNDTTQTQTLAAFASADNWAFGTCTKSAATGITQGAGFTALSLRGWTNAGATAGFAAEAKLNDNTLDYSWPIANGNWASIAAEIKANSDFDFFTQYPVPTPEPSPRVSTLAYQHFIGEPPPTPAFTPTDFDFYCGFILPTRRIRSVTAYPVWGMPEPAEPTLLPEFDFYSQFPTPTLRLPNRIRHDFAAWSELILPPVPPGPFGFVTLFMQPLPPPRDIAPYIFTAWPPQLIVTPPTPVPVDLRDFPTFPVPRGRVYSWGLFQFSAWNQFIPNPPREPPVLNVGIQATLVMTVNDLSHRPFAQSQKIALPMLKFQGTIDPAGDLAEVSVRLQEQVAAQCTAWLNELMEMEKGAG